MVERHIPTREFVTYDTGAKRESQAGKGRYDLMPPDAITRILTAPQLTATIGQLLEGNPYGSVMHHLACATRRKGGDDLAVMSHLVSAWSIVAAMSVVEARMHAVDMRLGCMWPEWVSLRNLSGFELRLYVDIPLERIAYRFGMGADKYDARNWEKGIPVARYADSAQRHLTQAEHGAAGEDHFGASLWNITAWLATTQWIVDGTLPATLQQA